MPSLMRIGDESAARCTVRDDEAMDVVLAAMVVLASAIAAVAVRRQARDQSYQGLPAGQLPPPGEQTAVHFVERTPVPDVPRPTPPDELSPGLTGVVMDGRADPIEVAATLVALAAQGRLSITERPAPDDSPLGSDWLFSRVGPAPEPVADAEDADAVEPVQSSPEDALLAVLFADAGEVALSELSLDQRRDLNQVSDLLLLEAERRHWFRRLTHPVDTSLRLAGPMMLLLGAVVIVMLGQPWIGAGLMVAGVLFWALTQGLPNPPVTADGYALRIQARGFRSWLNRTDPDAQAEVSLSDQVGYLPYAMVLGAVEPWRAALAQAAGTSAPDGFGWLTPLATDGRLLAADGAIPGLAADLAQHLVAARSVSDVATGANLIPQEPSPAGAPRRSPQR